MKKSKKEGIGCIKLPFNSHIEKHKLFPQNWITRFLVKYGWIKIKIKHYKIKNPIVELLNKETSVYGLLPKHKLSEGSWKTLNELTK